MGFLSNKSASCSHLCSLHSVIWVCPPPNQSFQQQRRGGWVVFRSRPWRESERCSPDPVIVLQHLALHLKHTSFLFCLPWSPGSCPFLTSGCWVPSSFSSCFTFSSSHLWSIFLSPVYERITLEEGQEAMGFGDKPGFKSQALYFLIRCLERTVWVFCPDLPCSFHVTLLSVAE